MTIELHLPTGTYILVKTPEDSYRYSLVTNKEHRDYRKFTWMLRNDGRCQSIALENIENLELIGPVSSITEEQAKEIVEFNQYGHNGWKYYLEGTSNYYWCPTALESFHSWLKANKIYTENPYSYSGNTVPNKSKEAQVSYDGGNDWDNSVEWMERRTCIMAGIAGGHGYFGEGWGTSEESGTDIGLICDNPDYFRYVEELDKWNEAQERTSQSWILLKKVEL